MDVGRGVGGIPPLDFEMFSKKCCFLVLSGKKIFTTFGHQWKNLRKIR